MIPKIEVSSLSVNRLKSGVPFEKYHIDVSIDEVENTDLGIKLKYKFVLLSTPTNAKISIDGITSLTGNENEISKYLEPDQKNIPMIVSIVYQELLPLLYVLTKSIDIPCPAYKISQISQIEAPQTTDTIQEESQVQTKQEVSESPKESTIEAPPAQESQDDVLDELEKLVEDQNISSV